MTTSVRPGSQMERLLFEIKKVIVGQDHLLERIVVALLARGHLLVEGVPGLAKTLAVKTVAQAISGEFHRIQFTPDLVPADLVGTRIYNQKLGEFQTSLGPVFTNLLLADEINLAQLRALQLQTQAVYVDPSLIEYAVALTGATRDLSSVGLAEASRYFSF